MEYLGQIMKFTKYQWCFAPKNKFKMFKIDNPKVNDFQKWLSRQVWQVQGNATIPARSQNSHSTGYVNGSCFAPT